MKILHVETGRHFLGGPQQVIYLINALRERGHDNTLVCPPNSGIDGVARQARIHTQNLFCAGDLDLPFAYRLTQFLKEHPSDLVHCHSRRGADVLGGLAASFADIPAVVSRRVDNTEMRALAALRYKPFRKIIAISEAVAKVLRDHKISAESIVVIRDAVDYRAFERTRNRDEIRNEFGIDDGVIAIAAAGQLIARKGHRYLLQAIAGLASNNVPVRLVIFGDGELDTELRALTSSLGLGGVVQFAGFRDDLDELIGCFDLFAHPALEEGLGVVTLKAAAAGVPVVGFKAGGLEEAVEHGMTGLLVARKDVPGLERALATLIDDPELRKQMCAAGKKRMQNEFSIDTMADRHVELYESILNG